MAREYLLAGLFVIFLGCAGIVNGADTKMKTETNDNDSGFSVENSSGDTIIRADGAGGFVIPRLTIDERDAMTPTAVNGMIIFNTVNEWFEGFRRGAWVAISPGGANSTNSTSGCGNAQVQDMDGNLYNTVQIGTQCWMSENLNVGLFLGAVPPSNNIFIEKYCFNDNEANCFTDGGLYEWHEMMQYNTEEGIQGICPIGWHIPTDAEWITLERYLGMTEEEGLLSEGPGPRGTDEVLLLLPGGNSGFNAIGAGHRSDNGTYQDHDALYIWTSSPTNFPLQSWNRNILSGGQEGITRWHFDKTKAASVRCIKD